ncbi:MAG: chemotaxis protein CheW [Terriglobales bacterium]
MTSATCLVVGVHGMRCMLPVGEVQEIVALPALTRVAEGPTALAGVLNLRGRAVPVLDLATRLGLASLPYRASDCVVILGFPQTGTGLLGLRVEVVYGFEESAAEAASVPPRTFATQGFGTRAGKEGVPVVEALTRAGDGFLMRLDLHRLASDAVLLQAAAKESIPGTGGEFGSAGRAEEQRILRERAARLAEKPATADLGHSQLLAVVRLGQENFGVVLSAIQGFVAVPTVTPVPGTPAHILGLANVRGELLAVVAPHAWLNLVRPSSSGAYLLLVVDSPQGRVGVAVEEVHEVVSVADDAMLPVPRTRSAQHAAYVTGVTPYASDLLTVLDIGSLLQQPGMQVDDER